LKVVTFTEPFPPIPVDAWNFFQKIVARNPAIEEVEYIKSFLRSSIKLKIDRTVGVGLLESEFN